MTKDQLIQALAVALRRHVDYCAECQGSGIMYSGKRCYSECRKDIELLKEAEKCK